MTDFLDQLAHEFDLPLRNPVLVFSLILFIILASPIVLRRLNVPSIIGLILSGVLVGPYGANLLEKSSAIELFSTIGLLYIMFIAGLELDLNEFRSNRNKSFLFGFFTFTFPLSTGYVACHYILGYDVAASILTASMFATHTLVAYPIVSKLGVSKHRAVVVAVGGTILTDTAVLLILAIIIGNNQGGLGSAFWVRLAISLAGFSAIMFLVVPKVARWFFRKIESEKHSHYIFVLSTVFFAAFLAEIAGVEPIIGAFTAGLALNRLIPHSSALMNRIEFIGNALFIPFFLISVGMLVDMRVLVKGPMAWVVAFTLSAVALLGKWLAAWATQLVFGYSGTERRLIFGLSSAHAAATLAVILVGYQARIIDENVLNGTIVLILLTCVVASFVTEKAARQIVADSAHLPDELSQNQSGRGEQILLPIANVENMGGLLEFSMLVKDKKAGLPISVLSVVSNNSEAEANVLKARKRLEVFATQASAAEQSVSIIATIDHNAASGIARVSREIAADIIVLGWPSRTGLIDKLVGEKLDNVLNNTDKTLFICHIGLPLMLNKRILVMVPPLAEHENGFALWFAKVAQLAKELSASVHIYCGELTQKAIEHLAKQAKLGVPLHFQAFEDWDSFSTLAADALPSDLFVLVSARKGAASHLAAMDNLPRKMERYLPSSNRIIVFPQQLGYGTEWYDGLSI